MSTYGTTRHHHSPATNFSSREKVTDYHTTLFRRLTWDGTVPLEIRVDPNELPANSDRNLECYYIQAPRVSYLPLLMPEIRRFFTDLVFDENSAKDLKEEDWWFETAEKTLIKWHWPIGLVYDNHTISLSTKQPSTSELPTNVTPLRLILHLASPPNDKLLLSPSPEACKQAFMGQLKEADFIRWGSTKRMTGLRQQDQDGLWEGIKEHNFEDYWRVAKHVTPTTAPTRVQSPAPPSSSASMVNRPPSADPAGSSERDGAYNVRSVPVRLYLPDGPVIQAIVPPMLDDNSPRTLAHYLTDLIPLLFPPQPPAPPPSRTNPHPRPPPAAHLAYVLVHGIAMPLEAEMAWLGGCLAGADGWVNVLVYLH